MKILLTLIISLFSAVTYAECTSEQKSAEIDVAVIRIPGSVEAGGNHGTMDSIAIHAPSEIKGLLVSAMELTRGEVAEFWIPLAYTINHGRAVTTVTGYQSAIQNFVVAVYYENSNCKKSVQRRL